jgi:hypothetical protein
MIRKLAELFARAELKRGSCAAAGTSATSADRVTGAEIPRLRGRRLPSRRLDATFSHRAALL